MILNGTAEEKAYINEDIEMQEMIGMRDSSSSDE